MRVQLFFRNLAFRPVHGLTARAGTFKMWSVRPGRDRACIALGRRRAGRTVRVGGPVAGQGSGAV